MGLFDGLKERMLSGTLYSMHAAVKQKYPNDSESDILAETCRRRFSELKNKYPDIPDLNLEEVKEMLIESEVKDLDTLVSFLIGFERKAAQLHR